VDAWLVEVLGDGTRVRRAERLPDGTTSEVSAVDAELPDGRTGRFVLRRYVDPKILASEEEPVQREEMALGALRATPVPAPTVIATDPDGVQCGVPALLMSRLPGRPRWWARDMASFVTRLAEHLPVIHATPVPAATTFPTYHGYHGAREPSAPSWTRHARAWTIAIARHTAAPPAHEPMFIHRDYHSGNVLWRDGQITGIVDWAWSCLGPQPVDVAHCRLNLVLSHGVDVADDFLQRWQSVSGVRSYDPTWDLIDAVDVLPDCEASTAALRRLDEFVARAASEL
jgi:aminoglycoside phosphotransferase (APT) family kinase protein